MTATLSWTDIAVRLALAIAAGFLVGLDRGMHAHRVGLRTTMLVAVAAATAMIQANWLMVHMPDTQVSIVRLDMMRLPLGILTGIGFIGGGAILRLAVTQLSHSHCRIQPLQFHAGVGGGELPVGFGVVLVATGFPGGDFVGQGLFVWDSPVETLRRQDAEFGFGHPSTSSGRAQDEASQLPCFGV